MNTDLITAALADIASGTDPVSLASPWRRSIAYLVDALLIGSIGAGLGRVLSQPFSRMGPWGILVGFFVASLYFGALECRIGNGQTLGKRLMKIRVVNSNGEAISFERALIRFAIFAVPLYLYDLKLPETKTPPIISALIFVGIVWIGGCTFYLLLFSCQSRQGLHDLATRTFVVYADHEGPVGHKSTPQMHWAIVGTLLFVVSAAVAFEKDWVERRPPSVEFHRDLRVLENLDGVERAKISETLTHGTSEGVKKTLIIRVLKRTPSAGEEAFASQVVRSLMQKDQALHDYDLIDVRLSYGYDIGIASNWATSKFQHSLHDWEAKNP